MVEILVLVHSVSGGTFGLAQAVAAGIEQVDDCRASLRRVPEIDNGDEIFGGHAPARPKDLLELPVASPSDLDNFDGFAVGCPVYFGRMSSAMSHFWDHTGKQWMSGSLTGRPATAFVGGGSGAGSETAMLSLWSTFATHGLTIIPLGIRAQGETPPDQITGTTSFGAATIGSAPGDRPSDAERAAARIQGHALADIALKLRR